MANTQAARIKEAAGQAPWKVLHCPHCNIGASSFEQDFLYPWSLKLLCKKCPCTWWVCRLCEDQRKHLQQKHQVSRHNRIYHKEEKPAEEADELETDDQDNPDDPPTQSSFNFLERPASKAYFEAASTATGSKYLIATAIGTQQNSMSSLDDRDVDMMMTLSKHVSTLTRTQREGLANVLDQTTEAATRHYESQLLLKHTKKKPDKDMISVPTTKQALRSLFCEGKNAVICNLPHPEIKTEGDHAYLLPSECVADLMAHGVLDTDPGETLHQVQSLAECKIAKAITAKNEELGYKSIFLSLWSDDFEPNYSKGNRGSVWLCTMTIQTAKSGTPRLNNVYPLVVGAKGGDHQKVMRIVLEDIRKLKRKDDEDFSVVMYDGKKKADAKVSAHLICVHQDQPERRSFAGLLQGGLGYHGRWGWTFNIAKVYARMPPCGQCLSDLQAVVANKDPVPRLCKDCFNFWKYPQEIWADPEEDFPKSELDEDIDVEGNTKMTITCKELSFSSLKEAVNLAHEKIMAGDWNKATSHAYLRRYCLNTDAREELIECASNCAIRENAIRDNDQTTAQAAEELMAEEPHKHAKWNYPAIWDSGLNIQQIAEPCMHLLFLGIMKNVTISDIQDWATQQNKGASIRRELLQMTSEVEQLHLSWCKVQPFKGEKLGGWVSENFMGFARIAPWAYSCIERIREDPPFIAPDKAINRWTGEECKDFLRSRRLSLQGKVEILKARVNDNINLPIPEPVGASKNDVRKMILCMWQMISFLMGMTELELENENSQVLLAESLIRLFLTSLETVDKMTRIVTRAKWPTWVSQYNYQCLLNIPEQIRILGPIRNRWEGGKRGEGFLRIVKPIVQKGRKNWQKNLLKKIVQQKSLIQVNREDDESDSDIDDATEDGTQRHEPQSFVVYSSLAAILRDWATAKVISVVMVGSDVFSCYRGSSSTKNLAQLEIADDSAEQFFGLWYHRLVTTDDDSNDNACVDEVRITCYGILLPLATTWPPNQEQDLEGQKYTIMTSHWMSWDKNGDVVQPYKLLAGEDYSETDAE